MQKLFSRVFLLLFISLAFTSYAQKITLEGVTYAGENAVKPIIDQYGQVEGYFLSSSTKLARKEFRHSIKIYDENLKFITEKEVSTSGKDNLYILDIKLNNQAIVCLLGTIKVVNTKYESFAYYEPKLVTLDKAFNVISTKDFTTSLKDGTGMYRSEMMGYDSCKLTLVGEQGFFFSRIIKNKKDGYEATFIKPNGVDVAWTKKSDIESGTRTYFKTIAANDKILVTEAIGTSVLNNKKWNVAVQGLDVNTGEEIFSIKSDYTTGFNKIENAVLQNDKMVFIGKYYPEKKHFVKSESSGLFTSVLDYTGKELAFKKYQWEGSAFTKLFNAKKDEDTKKQDKVLLQETIVAPNGDLYIIAEQYGKATSGLGLATAILLKSNAGASNLLIGDAFVFQFSKDLELKDITKFDKGLSKISSMGMISDELAAFLGRDSFDYQYTDQRKDQDEFYSVFIDYERIKKSKDKLAIVAIINDKGTFSTDKISFDKDTRKYKTFIKRAKLGHVLFVNFDKKMQTLSCELKKFNY